MQNHPVFQVAEAIKTSGLKRLFKAFLDDTVNTVLLCTTIKFDGLTEVRFCNDSQKTTCSSYEYMDT
jgi:hypothetical protein